VEEEDLGFTILSQALGISKVSWACTPCVRYGSANGIFESRDVGWRQETIRRHVAFDASEDKKRMEVKEQAKPRRGGGVGTTGENADAVITTPRPRFVDKIR
jgi:hypothetical protein